MNEVKQPKKPLIFYYLVVMLILALFNSLAMHTTCTPSPSSNSIFAIYEMF